MQWRMVGRRGRTATWTIVGDPAQSSWPVPGGGRRRPRGGARGQGRCHEFHLSTNYRNSAEIYDFAAAYAERVGLDADLPDAVRSTGVEPPRSPAGRRPRGRGPRGGRPSSPARSRAPSAIVVPVARRARGQRLAGVVAGARRRRAGARPRRPGDAAGEDRVVVLTGLDTKGLEFDGIVVVAPAGDRGRVGHRPRDALRRAHPRHPAAGHRRRPTRLDGRRSRRRSRRRHALGSSAMSRHDRCPGRASTRSRSDAAWATRPGRSIRLPATRADASTLVGGRRAARSSGSLDVPLEEGVPDDGPHASTGWSRSRSGRSPSAASRRTTTAPRWSWSTSRPSTRSRSPSCSTRCPTTPVEFADRGGFETDDEEYAERRRARSSATRSATARAPTSSSAGTTARSVADWGADKALTVFRRLLERERGAYWTFCFFTGDRYLVGASPERHVTRARRRRADEPDQRHLPARAGSTDRPSARPRLLDFLADEKEIYELFMVVDEELKMMCDICHEGGQVLGPFLKPMTHLVHTEYLLAGRTDRDVREVLRDTMYAATVTGAPGRERLPADQAVRDRGPRLLRRRARAARPRRATARRPRTARS